MDTIELGRCVGLWVSFALILNQPLLQIDRGLKETLTPLEPVCRTTKPSLALVKNNGQPKP